MNPEPFLLRDFLVRKAKHTFYNTSPLDFEKLRSTPPTCEFGEIA